MKKRGMFRTTVAVAAFLLAFTAAAFAQDAALPKSIDVYVPAKAGGGTDVMARSLSNQISKVAGTTMVILNNVDGNGVVALETVRNARPDGKTILQFHTTMIIQSAMGKYKYNILDDFTVIGAARNPVESGYILLVPPSAPYNNAKEFVEYAKKNPGKLLTGIQTGGSSHLMVAMFEKAAGIKLRAVEAGSDTEKLTALAGNNINAAFVNPNQAKQYVEAGKLKALGSYPSDEKGVRTVILPQVPSLAEQGYAVEFDTVSFILGPKGMDKALVARLHEQYKAAALDKSVDALLAKAGMQLRFYEPEEALKKIQTQVIQLTEAVNEIGLGPKK